MLHYFIFWVTVIRFYQQGSLVANFLPSPLYLNSVVVGGDKFDDAACARAFFGRYGEGGRPVRILHAASPTFEHAQNCASAAAVPCPDSIVWMGGGQDLRETIVAGGRQGWSRKRLAANCQAWSAVSQQLLAEFFVETCQLVGWSRPALSYGGLKAASLEYNETKRRFKARLPTWPSEEPKRRLADSILLRLPRPLPKE